MRSVKIAPSLGLVFLSTVFFLVGCSKKADSVRMAAEEYFKRGEEAFQKKRYDKAIDNFNMVLLNSPGGELADDAQYYLGDCYFEKKEYLLAASEYQQLTERYSYSPLVEKAYFRIALSYFEQSPKYPLDQQSTVRALQYFQDFIDAYPASELRPEAEEKITDIRNKLSRKVFENGKLYRKMQYYDSAILYLDKMLDEYYDTKWAVFAHLEKAYCYIRLRQFDQYREMLKIVDRYAKTPEIEKYLHSLERVYNREKRKIAREEKRRQRQ